jgi:hypothetical protein
MTEHQRFLALAATSIDFRLTPDEQHALRAHLAGCDSCGATVRGMLDDATRLAAAPQPAAPAAVRDALIRAAVRGTPRTGTMRWPLVAALLAVLIVAGTFVAGSFVDRLQGNLPVPTPPTVVDRATPEPGPSAAPTARPTLTPRYVAGWNDLGDITDEFAGRSVMSVMAGPDGGLVAFGLDRTTADVVVWDSDDGVHWRESSQPSGVLGGSGDVPTTGVLGGPGIMVVGWATSTEGRQRAIWSSVDGRTWSRTADLGVASEDLTLAAGPAGMMVWTPSGRAWVSEDGNAWRSTDIGREGISDVAVDDEGFVVVGRSGSVAFLVTSRDGKVWGTPRTEAVPQGTQVGIERAADGVEAEWIGDQRWRRSGSTWRVVQDASMPRVPAPASVVGGKAGLLALGSPTSAGAYRAWTWDGSGEWDPSRIEAEAGTGAPAVIDAAPYGDGWFLMTHRGGKLHGWFVEP